MGAQGTKSKNEIIKELTIENNKLRKEINTLKKVKKNTKSTAKSIVYAETNVTE